MRIERSMPSAPRLINARAETVTERPAFRAALLARRCLLPADGYYEWRRDPDDSRKPYVLTADGGQTLASTPLARHAAPEFHRLRVRSSTRD